MRVIKSYEVHKIRDLFTGRTVAVPVIGPQLFQLDNGLTVEVEPWEADCWCGEGDCEIIRIAGVGRPIEAVSVNNRKNQGLHTICAATIDRSLILLEVQGRYGHHDTGYDLVVR